VVEVEHPHHDQLEGFNLISSFCSSVQVFAVSLTSVPESPQTTLRLANASDVTPRMRDFHSLGVLSIERTFIFATQGAHTRLAQWGLSSFIETLCFYVTFVLVDNLVFQNPPLRQAWERYLQL
jgi:hypothetical protein